MSPSPSTPPDRRGPLAAGRRRPSRGLLAALLVSAVLTAAAAPAAGASEPDQGGGGSTGATAAAEPSPSSPAVPGGSPPAAEPTVAPTVPTVPDGHPRAAAGGAHPGARSPSVDTCAPLVPGVVRPGRGRIPEPSVPILTGPDALSRYQGQVSCDPVEKPGAQRLRGLLRTYYGKANSGGITRACSIGGRSDHKEGRAYDWALDANNPSDRAIADQFLAWAVGPDGAGVPAGNAARLGVQYIIWDRQIWQSWSNSWKPYNGASPHTDHIHLSLSWDGAFARTSWWSGSAVTRVDHGPCQVYEGVLVAPYSAPNYTPCPPPVRQSVVPAGNLDEARPVLGGVVVRGWTRDFDTPWPIDVHAYVDGAPAGAFRADRVRADVGPHGFEFRLPLSPGEHRVCVYAIDVGVGGSNPLLGCAAARQLANPFGSHDGVQLVPGGHRTSGWAIDPDTTDPVKTHVYVDGRFAAELTASRPRPDVGRAFPGRGDDHGFSGGIALSAGDHDVCAYGLNIGEGDANPLLGCHRVTSPGSAPFGSLDSARGDTGAVLLSGWALDPDVTSPVMVHVYVDGVARLSARAVTGRSDVGRAYPGWGSAHGFQATVTGLQAGARRVCVYAINEAAGTENPLLACRSVDVR
jgi:hypothetical protein